MTDAPEHAPSLELRNNQGRPPKWMPSWMSERERCALILAIGIVFGMILSALIFSIGIYISLHESPINIR